MKNRLFQAYKQAPWRIQIQWIGLFLLVLVLFSAVAGVYLNISQQAAAKGRKIQSLEYKMGLINNEIAELTTDLAEAQSADKMAERAEKLGFRLLDPTTAIYLEIPGYNPDAGVILAPPRAQIINEAAVVQSSYKSSLWDWFVKNIWQLPVGPSKGGSTP